MGLSTASPKTLDHDVLDELARRYGRCLRRMAAEALGRLGQRADRHRIEDLVQDVYCKLLTSGRPPDPRGRRERQVLAYLRRTVRSAAVDGLRIAAAAKRSNGDRRSRTSVIAGPAAETDPVDPAPTPEQRLLMRDRRRRFLAACRSAAGSGPRAARDARVTMLALLDGWSSREISAALGGRLRPASVDAAVSRMRGRLAAVGVVLPRRPGARTRRRPGPREVARPAMIARCASTPRPVASTIPRPPVTPNARSG